MMDYTPTTDPLTSLYSMNIDYNGGMCCECFEHVPLTFDNEREVYREEIHVCEGM